MHTEKHGAAHRLRLGRCSLSGHIYLITTVTRGRVPLFADFGLARRVIGILREEQARGSHLTLAYVLMPDHLHWLLQLQRGSLQALVGRIKSLSARGVGRSIWQDGFHDRAVRHEREVQPLARYIVANPVRAGLVARVGLYPHWDAIWI